MASCESKYFGVLEYEEDAILSLPRGLLGFEQETSFVLIQRREEFPLVYMQSRNSRELCFLALPILTVDPKYEVELDSAGARLIGTERRPAVGTDVLCLTLLTVHPEGPTANLLAPVVVNLKSHVGCQTINLVEGYSHQHELCAAKEGAAA